MLSPLLDLPGAVSASSAEVARHYGQPLAESRSLEEGRAVVDLSHRGVLTVTGADRLSWLDSMTSQLLRTLQPGESAETLLLSPQGRIDQLMRVVDDGDTAWLLVDEGRAEAVFAFLHRMRFALRVEVTDVSAEYVQLGAFGDELRERLTGALSPVVVWRDPWQEVQRGGFQYSAEREIDWNFATLVVPRASLETLRSLVMSGEARAAGLDAFNALEVRAWRVGMADVDDRTIPHELDWMRTAVHLNKGCFRGQETVAKVHNLGHPPRRIAMLNIEGSEGEVPEAGALLRIPGQDRPVGLVTRAALHHDWGVIALAMLKRRTDPEAQLEVELASGGVGYATQEIIVPLDAGATRDIPKLRRL